MSYMEYGLLECPMVSVPSKCRKNTSLSSCNICLKVSLFFDDSKKSCNKRRYVTEGFFLSNYSTYQALSPGRSSLEVLKKINSQSAVKEQSSLSCYENLFGWHYGDVSGYALILLSISSHLLNFIALAHLLLSNERFLMWFVYGFTSLSSYLFIYTSVLWLQTQRDDFYNNNNKKRGCYGHKSLQR